MEHRRWKHINHSERLSAMYAWGRAGLFEPEENSQGTNMRKSKTKQNAPDVAC